MDRTESYFVKLTNKKKLLVLLQSVLTYHNEHLNKYCLFSLNTSEIRITKYTYKGGRYWYFISHKTDQDS